MIELPGTHAMSIHWFCMIFLGENYLHFSNSINFPQNPSEPRCLSNGKAKQQAS